jgi:D-arabinose 1-dehydrogenase-like Zn-dependent alcohol dehydrogenase
METATPVPTGTEAVVRIHHCGVCHSDIHIHDGYFDLGAGKQLDVRAGRQLPFTLGHEIEGEVVALGPDATGVSIGDRRAVYPWMGCGDCAVCKRGDEHLCTVTHHLGITVDGGYATHVLVPHPRYLLDFGGIDPAIAGAFMCSGLTAYSALKKLGTIGSDDPVMIVGLGGVGMMGLQIAKALFPSPPLAADIDPAKRDLALKAGAAAVFDPADRDARKAILKETGGVAGVVDFVGAEASFQFAQGLVRKGGSVVVSGLMGGRLDMPLPMLPLRALSLVGTFVGSLPEAREMLELARRGRISPIPIERRPLGDANRSLEDLRNGRVVGRIVLTP